MSTGKDVQLSAGLDATGVRTGVEEVKTAVQDMAGAVKKDADAASKSVGGVGDGAAQAAAKVDRSTRSIIGSIERTTAATQAGDRGSAAYFETLGKQRGVSAEVLKPYLDQLRQAEAAQKLATGSLDKMGISAKQTAYALRGVPAQFTDIVTSLQGGQKPLTVLLQQGGQLKDMFGGAGNAAKALGGYVLGLVNPITIAAAVVAGLALAYKIGADELSVFQRTLILSGNAAGVTAGQLSDMAASVAKLGAGTQGKAAEILAQIAESSAVGAGNMVRFTAAAIRFEQVGGSAASETAKAFASLAKAPLEASLKLNEATNFLTVSTYQQIKALEEQGRTVDAARVAQEAYFGAIDQRTPALLASLGTIERAWIKIKEGSKGALDAVLGIGRALSPGEQIAALQERMAKNAASSGGRDRFYDASGNQVANREAANASLRDGIAFLQEQARLDQRSAEAAGQRAASVKAAVEWDKETDKYLSKQAQQAREIAKAEGLGLAAGRSRAEIEQQIAAIRTKYAEKATAAPKIAANSFDLEAMRDYAKGLDDLGRIAASADASAKDLSKTQAKLREIQSDPSWATYNRQQKEQIIFAASLAQANETQAESVKQSAKAADDAGRAYGKWISEIKKGAEQAEQQAEKLQIEAEAAVIVASSYYSLAQAVELVEIARLKERLVAARGNEEAVLAIKREIVARQNLVDLIGGKDAREASAKAAKEAASDWKKTAEKIEESITDALLRGFESGKSAAKAFRDALLNMFKTLVLRPIVQWAVQPLQGVIGSFLGQGPGAAGAAGPAGVGSSLQGLSSLYSAGRNLAAGFSGLSLGVSNAAGTLSANAAGTGIDGLLASNGAYGTAGTGAGWAGTLGSAAGIGAGVLGGVYGGRAISGGYSAIGGNTGNSAVNTGTAIGAVVGSIIPVIGTALGALIGGLLGGVTNRLFGRKAPEVTDQGITGTIGNGDFTGTSFRDVLEKGGIFRSDKRYTQTAALPDDLNTYLDNASKSLLTSVTAFGKTLGLPVEQLAGITTKVRATLSSDAAKNQTAITEALTTYTDALVITFKAQIEPLRKYGETLEAALSRLSVLQTFSESLNQLGGVFSGVARQSIDARESFIAMAGGMQALSAKALTFAQQYYTREEIAGLRAGEVKTVLAGAGINADSVGSREDFRRLVEATDVSTAAGREQLAVLLNVAGSFAEVADYIAQSGSTLARVAAQAPTSGPVASLLAPAAVDNTEQVGAINNVGTAVDRVGGLLGQLIELVRNGNRGGFSLEVARP